MNSKLVFIALVSLFFQAVMTATVLSKLEDVKAVTSGSVIEHVVNETKPEATKGSNTTEMSDGIEYRNTTTAAPSTPTVVPSTNTTVKPEPVPTKTTETPANSSSTTPATVKPEPVPTKSTETPAKTSSTTPATVKPEPVPTKTTETPAKTSSTTPATVKPEPTATPETSVKAPSSTPATVIQTRSFDAPNFIGGIILTLGLTAIGFVAYKFYKARKAEANYRTL